jgi:hypothetical protein
MGYYTKFYLSIEEGKADMMKVHDCFAKLAGNWNGMTPWYLEEGSNNMSSDDTMTWYDHDDDCANMSKHFPNVTFCLEGQGEEPSDTWKAYYRNGLIQICRGVITYPPYDISKLKPVFEAQQEDSQR